MTATLLFLAHLWDHVCSRWGEKTASPGQWRTTIFTCSHQVLVCRASFYHTDTQCITRHTEGFGCHPTRSHCSPRTKLPFAYDLASNYPKPRWAGALYFKASFIIFDGEAEEFSRWHRWSHWSRVSVLQDEEKSAWRRWWRRSRYANNTHPCV